MDRPNPLDRMPTHGPLTQIVCILYENAQRFRKFGDSFCPFFLNVQKFIKFCNNS